MRSDCLIPKIRDNVIKLLNSTILTHTEIGKMVGCSRGPIYTIYKDIGSPRRGRKHLPVRCKTCNCLFFSVHLKSRSNRGKFCSKDCYTQWQKSDENKGQNNPAWKGGYESPTQLIRKTDEWKEWRKNIFARDKYTCQYCKGKTKDSQLNVHHIIERSNGGSDNESNLITLCKTCHDKVHSGAIVLTKIGHRSQLNHATHMNILQNMLKKQLSKILEAGDLSDIFSAMNILTSSIEIS